MGTKVNVQKIKLYRICVRYSHELNYIFDIYNSSNFKDCHDTCIVWNTMTFYGIPFDFEDERMTDIYEGDYTSTIKIGSVYGCLVMCKQIIDEGEDPWVICDDVNGDLEYTISALRDIGGPLNQKSGNPYQDVYYIHEFEMEKGFKRLSLKARVLNELPKLIFSALHVKPDILAFYPEPREYELTSVQKEERERLRQISVQKLNRAWECLEERDDNTITDDSVISFTDMYQFTEDELNFLMRRRYSGSSYPEEAKNIEEFSFYEAQGFKEVVNSRLLYKRIGR